MSVDTVSLSRTRLSVAIKIKKSVQTWIRWSKSQQRQPPASRTVVPFHPLSSGSDPRVWVRSLCSVTFLFSSSHAPTRNHPRRRCLTARRPSTSTVPLAWTRTFVLASPLSAFMRNVLPQSMNTPGFSGRGFSVTDALSLDLFWRDRRQVCLISLGVILSGTSHYAFCSQYFTAVDRVPREWFLVPNRSSVLIPASVVRISPRTSA